MNTHLTPELMVEAIDGTLSSAAREHLSACGECRAEVDRVRAILREAESAAPAREPSPLFWDHFADRVRDATATLPVASRSSGWSAWWRPALLVGGALAVIALVVATPRLLPTAPAADQVVAVAEPAPGLEADVEGWDLVVSLTDDLGWDEVQQVARPRRGVADAMIDELSPAERAMFVKLLKQEMGGLE
jgi:anti-sigma factor RsiW